MQKQLLFLGVIHILSFGYEDVTHTHRKLDEYLVVKVHV